MGWVTGKVRSLNAIVVGIGVSAIAIYALGMSANGWWCLGAIGLFSFGEMTASPTKMRYLAGIAPAGKEGLYMGYVNFTVGIGWSIGSVIAGNLYEDGGDKANLAYYDYVHGKSVAAIVDELTEEELIRSYASMSSLSTLETINLLFEPSAIKEETDAAGLLNWYQSETNHDGDFVFPGAIELTIGNEPISEIAANISSSTGIPIEHITRIPNADDITSMQPLSGLIMSILKTSPKGTAFEGEDPATILVAALSRELGISLYAAQRLCFTQKVQDDGMNLKSLNEKITPLWNNSEEASDLSASDREEYSNLALVLSGIKLNIYDSESDSDQTKAVLDIASTDIPDGISLGDYRQTIGAERLSVGLEVAPLRDALVFLAKNSSDEPEKRLSKIKGFFQRTRIVKAAARDKTGGVAFDDIRKYEQYLWETKKPYLMWRIFALIGVASMFLIMIYNKVVTAANRNPEHTFNVSGQNYVTMALVPISLAFWFGAYSLEWDDMATIVQAILFSSLWLVSFNMQRNTN
jgi:MFS family permease